MKKTLLIIIGMALGLPLAAQRLTLDTCQRLARANYPAVRQYDLIALSRDYTLDNALKAWLPQVSVRLSAMAFTDVVDGQGQPPVGAGLDMENWLAAGSVSLSQQLYDGGRIRAQRNVTAAGAEVEQRRLDVTLYDLHERVQQLYFGLLLLAERQAQTRLLIADLGISRRTVEALMRGGMANQSDLDAVDVEQARARQMLDAQEATRLAYLRMLGHFIHRDLGADVSLEKPSADVPGGAGERPEMAWYAAQERLLEAQRRLLDRNLLPRLSAFGMGVYHTDVTPLAHPALLAGGLTLRWDLGALYTRRNDLRRLETQRAQVDVARSTFVFNNRLQQEDAGGTLSALRRQLAHDEEIVALRERIRSKSEKKVELGTQSVNEMLRDINAVGEARQQKALHEVQLLREIYRLNVISGRSFQ